MSFVIESKIFPLTMRWFQAKNKVSVGDTVLPPCGARSSSAGNFWEFWERMRLLPPELSSLRGSLIGTGGLVWVDDDLRYILYYFGMILHCYFAPSVMFDEEQVCAAEGCIKYTGFCNWNYTIVKTEHYYTRFCIQEVGLAKVDVKMRRRVSVCKILASVGRILTR